MGYHPSDGKEDAMPRLKRIAHGAAALAIILGTAIRAQTGNDIRHLDALIGRDLWKDRASAGVALSLLDRLVGNVPKGFVTEPASVVELRIRG